MRLTRYAMAAPAAMALSLLLASAVLASGPGNGSGNGSGNNGRSQITVVCDNGQSYTVAKENGGQSVGAGQVVGAHGHGILVSGTVTGTDTTASVVLFQGTIGHGSGHANQATTACTSVQTLTVADLGPPPGGVFPPGVAPSDTLVITVDVIIVLKV
jgi:hypothetical protein